MVNCLSCCLQKRFLLDNYTCQTVSTAWNGAKSKAFSAVNGVRQGGVLSPILFTIYFDEMLSRLRENGIGCKIGTHYVGAVAYADDVTLMCPSRKGLQQMINICEKFGQEYCVNFNAKKTQCIDFGIRQSGGDLSLTLSGKKILWEKQVNHLGNILCFNLSEEEDINRKKGAFIGNVNKLFCNFGKLQSEVLIKLFQNYCCSFYGSVLWKQECDKFKEMCVAWNKAVRRIWRLPYIAHTNILGPLNSKNAIIVNFIAHMAHDNRSGFIYRNVTNIKWKYDINMFDTGLSKSKCIDQIYNVSKLNDDVLQTIDLLIELLHARDTPGVLPGFHKEEVVEMIADISTGF